MESRDLFRAIRRGSPPHLAVAGIFVVIFGLLHAARHDFRRHVAEMENQLEAEGRLGTHWHPDLIHSSVRVVNPRIASLIMEMMERSPTLDRQIRDMAAEDIPVYIGTNGDLGLEPHTPYSGQVQFVFGYRLVTVEGVLISLRLDLFDEMYSAYDPAVLGIDPMIIRNGEIMGAIAHEIAHAYDVVISGGNWLRTCHDPLPWQDDLSSCVMKRENELRAELGLPLKTRYGMEWNAKRAAARYQELAGLQ